MVARFLEDFRLIQPPIAFLSTSGNALGCQKTFGHLLSRSVCGTQVSTAAVELGTDEIKLVLHDSYTSKQYRVRYRKPNPYTTMERIEREKLPRETVWLGVEDRPGWVDTRLAVLKRDNYTCRYPGCGKPVTAETAQVDHIRPYRAFKRPVDANRPENLWTLCIECHRKKTEIDRRRESRVQ